MLNTRGTSASHIINKLVIRLRASTNFLVYVDAPFLEILVDPWECHRNVLYDRVRLFGRRYNLHIVSIITGVTTRWNIQVGCTYRIQNR